ncbi:hypothetical protein Ancab_019401 [Ancistrocladus abbreviatus]
MESKGSICHLCWIQGGCGQELSARCHFNQMETYQSSSCFTKESAGKAVGNGVTVGKIDVQTKVVGRL